MEWKQIDLRDILIVHQVMVSVNDRYIVGYTFFAKGEPGYLLGTVSSNDQEERYIEEVTKTVDDMIKTLRDVE